MKLEIKTMELELARTIPASPSEAFDGWLDAQCPGNPWSDGAKLMTGDQDPAGYQTLKIAVVSKSAKAEAVPELQRLTAHLAVAALQWTNIPVYLEGTLITIPSGAFEVAEACAGLRFLVVTLAIATLVAGLAISPRAGADALPFLAPGDPRLRHLVELGTDAGEIPLSTTWPIPTLDLPAEQRATLYSIQAPGTSADAGWFLAAAGHPACRRSTAICHARP